MQQDTESSAVPEQPPNSTLFINRVGIRVPPFWPEEPAVWFAQLEGHFFIVKHHAGRDEILLRYLTTG